MALRLRLATDLPFSFKEVKSVFLLKKQKKPPKGLFPDIIQEQASGGSTRIRNSKLG
jgi:hypothetical protein